MKSKFLMLAIAAMMMSGVDAIRIYNTYDDMLKHEFRDAELFTNNHEIKVTTVLHGKVYDDVVAVLYPVSPEAIKEQYTQLSEHGNLKLIAIATDKAEKCVGSTYSGDIANYIQGYKNINPNNKMFDNPSFAFEYKGKFACGEYGDFDDGEKLKETLEAMGYYHDQQAKEEQQRIDRYHQNINFSFGIDDDYFSDDRGEEFTDSDDEKSEG